MTDQPTAPPLDLDAIEQRARKARLWPTPPAFYAEDDDTLRLIDEVRRLRADLEAREQEVGRLREAIDRWCAAFTSDDRADIGDAEAGLFRVRSGEGP